MYELEKGALTQRTMNEIRTSPESGQKLLSDSSQKCYL